MPAKVIEPDGNTMGAPTGTLQCGYLVRADVSLDHQGELKRIPFINDNSKKLKKGDLVMIEDVEPYNAVITSTDNSGNIISGHIMIAKIATEHFGNNWEPAYKGIWNNKWGKLTQDKIDKLQLKPGVDLNAILNCNGKNDVDGISLLPE